MQKFLKQIACSAKLFVFKNYFPNFLLSTLINLKKIVSRKKESRLFFCNQTIFPESTFSNLITEHIIMKQILHLSVRRKTSGGRLYPCFELTGVGTPPSRRFEDEGFDMCSTPPPRCFEHPTNIRLLPPQALFSAIAAPFLVRCA